MAARLSAFRSSRSVSGFTSAAGNMAAIRRRRGHGDDVKMTSQVRRFSGNFSCTQLV